MRTLIIKADYNDADYVTSQHDITDEELESIMPVIKCLQDRRNKLFEDRNRNWTQYRHNWETGEMKGDKTPVKLYLETKLLTLEQVKTFEKYLPYSEYGIHTIETIELVEKKVNFLKDSTKSK